MRNGHNGHNGHKGENGHNGHAGGNGHAAGGRLDELLAGLGPVQRVERLGEMLRRCDAEKPAGAEKAAPAGEAPPLPPVADGDAPAGQDAKSGRFLPGNKLGRGNPHARRQAELRNVLAEAVGAGRLRKIAGKVAELAEGGDLEAAKLLFSYLLGKPGPAPDPDRLDLEEWKLLDAQPSKHELMRARLDTVDAAEAADKLRKTMASDSEAMRAVRSKVDLDEVAAARAKRHRGR